MTKKICLEPLKSALGLSISHYYQDFTGAGGILAKKSRKHFEWKDMFWTLPYFLVVRITISRSSHRRYSVIEGVLTNFANFTRKHYLCCSFFKKRLQHRKKASILKKICKRLLLYSLHIVHAHFRGFMINYSFIIKMTAKNETRDAVIIWLFILFSMLKN